MLAQTYTFTLRIGRHLENLHIVVIADVLVYLVLFDL